MSPVREREKKKSKLLNGTLSDALYTSQLFCGLNYDDIAGQLQMQKTQI